MDSKSIIVQNPVSLLQGTTCTTASKRSPNCNHRIRDNPSRLMMHLKNIVIF